jgi:hypothetical protein
MTRRRRLVQIGSSLLCAAAPPARANLCDPSKVEQRHRTEAQQSRLETFSGEASYAGDAGYEARVIGCNRDRDNNRKKIEDGFQPDHPFAANLTERLVQGGYAYFNVFFFTKGYGYALSRKDGTWMVTVPVEFHLPASDSSTVDLPGELAITELGIDCHTAKHQLVKRYSDPGMSDTQQACRVGRAEMFKGLPATTWLMKFWQKHIQDFWSHDGFKVRIRVVNLGEIDEITLKGYTKGDVVWHVRMDNHETQTTARFRGYPTNPRPIYVGTDWGTFVHEFGHELGLDDEYPNQQQSDYPPWRDCDALSGGGADDTKRGIMCTGGHESSPATYEAKGVYDWIVTRRYVIGEESRYQCATSNDCDAGTYCDTGTLTFGANRCVPFKAECESCSADKQCRLPATCNGTPPFAKCATPGVLALGATCCQDYQCNSGSCSTARVCQCRTDADCGSPRRCHDGLLSANLCYTPGSKNAGQSCVADDECKVGKCNSNHLCVCKDDGDCGAGMWCDGGFDLTNNVCRAKLGKGAVCGGIGELGVGHRCKSGDCKLSLGDTKLTCK